MLLRLGIAGLLTAVLSFFALSAPHAQFNGCTTGFCTTVPVGGGGGGYTGPGNVAGSSGALLYFSSRGYNTAYASGSNNAIHLIGNDTTATNILVLSSGNLDKATATSFLTTHGSPGTIDEPYDQSGSGNNGSQPTLGNRPTLNTSTGPTTNWNTSFNFSTSASTYWQVAGTGPSRSSFTFIAWVKVNSTATQLGILGGDSAGASFSMNSGGTLQLDQAGVNPLGTSSGSITAGGWHQVAVTWDNSAGVSKFYIDGAPSGTTTLGSGQTFSFTNFYVGGAFSLLEWDGEMAEITVFGSVLTPTNISDNYNNALIQP